MDKDIIQNKAVSLLQYHKAIILEWGTNVGKSRAFIKIQEKLQAKKVLVVVAEVLHQSNWKTQYEEYNKELLNGVTFICYQSLHKYMGESFDLICLDEVHWLTNTRVAFLKSIKCKYLIGLSATINNKARGLLYELVPEYFVYKIGLKEAIESNLVSSPIFYLYPLDIGSDALKSSFIIKRGNGKKQISCSFKNYKKIVYDKLKTNYELEVQCTAKEHLEYLESSIQYYKEQVVKPNAPPLVEMKLKRLGLERKLLFGTKKTEIVEKFLKGFNKRFLCFCVNIQQANILGKDYAIHSINTDNDILLSKFNNGEVNRLFAVKMLQEGVNLINIEASIIIQLDKELRSFVQKSGRALRSKETPEIHVFYFKNTSDENYLQNAIFGIKKEYIYYVHL